MTEETARLIRELVDVEIQADSESTRAEAAERIIERLRRSHPGAFEDWIQDQAMATMVRYIGEVNRSLNARAIAGRPFVEMRANIEAGIAPPPRLLDMKRPIDDEGHEVPLRLMTGSDHRYVADAYHKRASSNLMQEAFHRALAKKVGARTTEEVLSEEQCRRVLDNITIAAIGRVA